MAKLTEDDVTANRIAWIRALRSGEYDQIQGTGLRVDGAYCCLGVAAELFTPGEWDGCIRRMPDGRFLNEEADVCHDWMPAYELSNDGSPLAALGMDDELRWLCIGWNDGSNFDRVARTFPEIADEVAARWGLD
jgi:hypothetical protein